VRFLNEQLGMTIFLTTQYLEEADALAHRVGIIARGKLVAEGTPTALKRAIGTDVIVAKVAPGHTADVVAAVRSIALVDRTEVSGDEVVLAVADGTAAISPVAVALAHAGVHVEGLTLRTPTLDDVFLSITGERMQDEAT
jgi:ABC-2 type transport system ATP-binding protein